MSVAKGADLPFIPDMKYNSNDLLQKELLQKLLQLFYLLCPPTQIKVVTLGEDLSLHCWRKLEKELMAPPGSSGSQLIACETQK